MNEIQQLSKPTSERTLMSSFFSTVLVFILTSFHHYYGAIVYQTPWRKHVVLQGGLILALCYLFYYLFNRYHKRAFLTIYLLLSFITFGLGIGIFEGAYNHVLKDILYFSGLISTDAWRVLFPSPAYEIPNDFIFESTGILQLVLSIIQMYYLWKVVKTNYKKEEQSVVR